MKMNGNNFLVISIRFSISFIGVALLYCTALLSFYHAIENTFLQAILLLHQVNDFTASLAQICSMAFVQCVSVPLHQFIFICIFFGESIKEK